MITWTSSSYNSNKQGTRWFYNITGKKDGHNLFTVENSFTDLPNQYEASIAEGSITVAIYSIAKHTNSSGEFELKGPTFSATQTICVTKKPTLALKCLSFSKHTFYCTWINLCKIVSFVNTFFEA